MVLFVLFDKSVINDVTVDAKLASSFIACANSFKVSNAPGAPSIKFDI